MALSAISRRCRGMEALPGTAAAKDHEGLLDLIQEADNKHLATRRRSQSPWAAA